MKFAVLLASLALSAFSGLVTATEADNVEDVNAYCTEQAEMAGIDNAEEKNQYVQECKESFSSGDTQQLDQ